ncbi:MAG: hypothetical protein HQK60_08620 [Deltaproteobacteria bacterium]|nr:hypothetical protein [Deltaproteobacteria bacterium]
MEKMLTQMLNSAKEDGQTTNTFHAGLTLRDLLLARLYATKFLETEDLKAADRAREEFGKMQEVMNTLDKELKDPKQREMFTQLTGFKVEYTQALEKIVKDVTEHAKDISNSLDPLGELIAKDVEEVKLSIMTDQDALGPRLEAANSLAVKLIMIIGLVAIVAGCLLAFVITRGITRTLNRVINGLSEGAEQVATASNQVASASQQLAEGTSEQAAAIEQTSSSLEEITSMTQQNAQNCNLAANSMKETFGVVEEAMTSMKELTLSMEETSKASDQTQKIVRTIDEIAFQTNLLALNAAVEAARAGEAGAGFAVVADEVRNLAMRAAEAAKTTASLIDDTVKKIKVGTVLVSSTKDAFEKVEQGSRKVTELVGEIMAASHEQEQGINQVDSAVNEMNKVTQQNASSAEESASASEELNAQAEQMKNFVMELAILVSGQGQPPQEKPASQESKTPIRRLKFHDGNAKVENSKIIKRSGAQRNRPEFTRPLSDAEFQEF